ncbi:MAG: peptidylprolyl isomerase [Bacillota bacterium]
MVIRVIIFWIFSGILFAQQEKEKVVASAGKCNIYESEFKERYDFSVHPDLKKKNDREESKLEFLKQLIAEKLLSLEAQARGYDTLEIFKDIMTPLDNMYIRDALYSKEIKEKVICSKEDIAEGIKRSSKQLKVNFIYSKDQNELDTIFQLLQRGIPFDSLLSLRPEVKDQVEFRIVRFGSMEKEIEDILFKLKIGEFTQPLCSKDGYYILKLADIENSSENIDAANKLEDIKRIIKTRSEYSHYLNYYNRFFGGRKISADKEAFEKLAKYFYQEFKEKYLAKVKETSISKFYLIGSEITSAEKVFQNTDGAFIRMPKGVTGIKYFLNQLSHDGLITNGLNEREVRSALSAHIKKFIEGELLAQEAIRQGLDNSKDIRKYSQMWKDSYLSKMLMLDIFDSVKVSDKEAFEIFKRSGEKPIPIEKVKIAEILTDSLEVIEKVLKELNNGKSFQELAKLYTKRDSVRSRSGEFDYFPVTLNGDLGSATSHMAIGDIYGPIKTEDGYSIIKLLDRKTDKPVNPQDFNEVKDQIKSKVTLSRFEKYINEFTAGLAQRYGVKIYEGALKQVSNVFINLVVVRYMGFGGEIFAVPYTEQFTGWYELWERGSKINM